MVYTLNVLQFCQSYLNKAEKIKYIKKRIKQFFKPRENTKNKTINQKELECAYAIFFLIFHFL